MAIKANDGSLKCPKCGSDNMLLTECRLDGDTICGSCQHSGPTFTFKVKQVEAVASVEETLAKLKLENASLKSQVEAATVVNQKRERENIGLKKQVVDLLVCISKLKAIRKELRNIIDLQREASR